MDILLSGFPLLAVTNPGDVSGTGAFGLLLFYITSALIVSFLCSVWEAVLLSTPVSYIELLVVQGNRVGILMQRLRQNVERPISAILTLNTIAHTVGAAGAGAEATAIFGSEYFGIISAILTLLILVLSEIIPKTIGAVYSKQLTAFTAYSLRFIVFIFAPAVWIFEFITRALRPDEDLPTVSRSELQVMARISAQEGGIQEQENRIVNNLLRLADIPVESIMTPRTVMMSLQKDMTVAQVVDKYKVIPFSRIPIYDENSDDVTGYVLRYEIYQRVAADEHDIRLEALLNELHAVPETNNVAQVLDQFIDKQEHILLVIDEYGGTAGLITLEDTLETLLGIEILDESDRVADLRELARRRYSRQLQMIEQLEQTNRQESKASDTEKPD